MESGLRGVGAMVAPDRFDRGPGAEEIAVVHGEGRAGRGQDAGVLVVGGAVGGKVGGLEPQESR